ncbi:MAG: cysteine desulfurase [Candidatus Bathyarchaeota archaeon]|nr:cysteine desulfurase [Candidatus Bathyarchaeota archaeon]
MDNGAARPVDPRVMETMIPYFAEIIGNPASFHSEGFKALNAIKTARKQVADLVNAEPEEIFFTSGATEANNLALIGGAQRYKKQGNRVIISAIEHISVINITKELTRQGFEVAKCPVDEEGLLDIDELEKLVDNNTVLISIMAANGEIGTVQPLKEVAENAHSHGALLHSDATAAAGQIKLDVKEINVDFMTLSSNDLGGPKGMGALFIKKGVRVKLHMIGGGQESGVRSGSENTPGIVGMGKAAEITKEEMMKEAERLTSLRDRLIEGLTDVIPESYLNGHPTNRVPNNANIRFSFIEGEALIMSLDDLGIQVSSGSACAAKTLEPSHTLLACGLKHEEAHGSLVFTLGKNNNHDQVEYVIKELPGVVKRLRAMSPLTPKELR